MGLHYSPAWSKQAAIRLQLSFYKRQAHPKNAAVAAVNDDDDDNSDDERKDWREGGRKKERQWERQRASDGRVGGLAVVMDRFGEREK